MNLHFSNNEGWILLLVIYAAGAIMAMLYFVMIRRRRRLDEKVYGNRVFVNELVEAVSRDSDISEDEKSRM